MATNIVFGLAGGPGGPPSHAAIARDFYAETLTASGTSQQSSNVAPNTQFGSQCPFVHINSDEAIWIAQGANPTAVANTCRRLLAGQMIELFIEPGHKVAILAE